MSDTGEDLGAWGLLVGVLAGGVRVLLAVWAVWWVGGALGGGVAVVVLAVALVVYRAPPWPAPAPGAAVTFALAWPPMLWWFL